MKKSTVASSSLSSRTFETRDFSKIVSSIRFFFKKVASISNQTSSTSPSNSKKRMKKIIPVAILVIGLGLILVVASRTLVASGQNNSETQRPTVKGPIATMDINKEMSFPLLDSKGKELTRIKYTVVNAELRDEIIVQGRRATAVEGRVFLILNIKIDNSFDKSLSINSRDYIRLSVNGNTEQLFAADIHNDPVSVQAISTKTTRLGFPINTTDTNLVLKVGEIKGDKEDINLSF